MPTTVFKCNKCGEVHKRHAKALACELGHGVAHKYTLGQKFLHLRDPIVITKLYFKVVNGDIKPYYSLTYPNGRTRAKGEHSLIEDVESGLYVELE